MSVEVWEKRKSTIDRPLDSVYIQRIVGREFEFLFQRGNELVRSIFVLGYCIPHKDC